MQLEEVGASEAKLGRGSSPRRAEDWLVRKGGFVELLRVPALLYGVVVVARRTLYDRGWLRSERLDVPVISVGNITAGGTGKTPFVAWLAARMQARGWRPGVLSRGYKAPGGGERLNDEGRVLERLLPEVARVQNPDRVQGGRKLVEMGVDVVLLDDGLQHRRLRRDLDLALIDASRPWGLPRGAGRDSGVRALLPRGLLREPPRRLAGCDAIVVTRVDQVSLEELERLIAEIQALAPGPGILLGVHRPTRLTAPDGRAAHPSALRGREVDLVSGIGNPEAFESTVVKLGARVCSHRVFRDHHRYAPGDLDRLGSAERWIVTTAKDAVKLGDAGVTASLAVYTLEVEFQLQEGDGVLDALLDSLPCGRRGVERKAMHEGLHG